MPTSNFDAYDSFADTLTSPARAAFAITPSDTTPLDFLPKAILVGTTGTLVLKAIDSNADVTIGVVAGQILPLRAEFIRATGTSASNLTGLA